MPNLVTGRDEYVASWQSSSPGPVRLLRVDEMRLFRQIAAPVTASTFPAPD
jgi:hypothetical protein